eukprot:365836-Chlamydomonas_euryale.AAC.5
MPPVPCVTFPHNLGSMHPSIPLCHPVHLVSHLNCALLPGVHCVLLHQQRKPADAQNVGSIPNVADFFLISPQGSDLVPPCTRCYSLFPLKALLSCLLARGAIPYFPSKLRSRASLHEVLLSCLLARGAIPYFPSRLCSRASLHEVLFLISPQGSALVSPCKQMSLMFISYDIPPNSGRPHNLCFLLPRLLSLLPPRPLPLPHPPAVSMFVLWRAVEHFSGQPVTSSGQEWRAGGAA